MAGTKLYLLTGFLGSGKTTFLLRLLEHLKDKKVGVIINEFGKIGIDGTVVKRNGMDLIELNRGAVFCACLKVPFINALIEMGDRKLDYVFVESSGLADPSNIGKILDSIDEKKKDVYDYRGAVCIVDAVNFLELSELLQTVERQIKHCHMAIINKVDLVDDSTLSEIIERIKDINPDTEIAAASYCEVDFGFLCRDLVKNQWRESIETTNTPENKPQTFFLTFEGRTTKEKLSAFLNSISKDAYRIKGFFMLEDGWNQVDVVNSRIDYKISYTEITPSTIVIISKIGTQIVKPIFINWKRIIGEPMKLR